MVPSTISLNERIINDIEAFSNIFNVGKKASWQLAVSPLTYKEVKETRDPVKRHYLENWFMEIWHYWLNILAQDGNLPSFIEAEHTKINLLSSGILDILPDVEDRILICDAIVYRCDCFCTRDWKTILKYRNHLKSLPIRIITPSEWWLLIKPYARLWL